MPSLAPRLPLGLDPFFQIAAFGWIAGCLRTAALLRLVLLETLSESCRDCCQIGPIALLVVFSQAFGLVLDATHGARLRRRDGSRTGIRAERALLAVDEDHVGDADEAEQAAA
jgi:hypothetical protein